MAKHFIITAFICFSQLTYGQSSEEAVKYLTEITNSLGDFRVETWEALKIASSKNGSEALHQKISDLITKINTTRDEVNNTEGFYGDQSAKVAMSVFLKTARDILTYDYNDIRTLEIHSEHSFENMEKYLMAQNKANERLSESGDRLDDDLAKFAERYEVVVTNEKALILEQIEKGASAINYYNQVYLTYFKVHQQKLQVYAALQLNNPEKIRAENAKLLSYTTESIQRLDILDSFLGDERLNKAAMALLEQHKSESMIVFPSAIRALEKQHIFSMAEAVFNDKPEAERTQTDADHLNSLIDPLNAAIDDQNKKLSESDQKRESLFRDWNSSIEAFFAAYLN